MGTKGQHKAEFEFTDVGHRDLTSPIIVLHAAMLAWLGTSWST
jgi:hypothetical protein